MARAGDPDWRLLLPRPIRELPADLAATTLLVLLTDLVVLAPGIRETPLRVVLGLPLVLFLPGYAFIAALFPEAGSSPAAAAMEETDTDVDGPDDRPFGERAGRDRGIDGIERVALSFGLSIAIVPLIGLVLNFTPWGIRLIPILVSVSGFTLLATAAAALRRWELPPEDRFVVPYRAWLTAGRRELFEPETRTDLALNVLLVLSILLAVSSVAYAVAVPKQGESFTEFYILTEDDDGELVAADYPTEFVRGEPQSVVIGIGNQEHEVTRYVVVLELQRVDRVGNETRVREEVTLDSFTARLAHNETRHTRYQINPRITGTRLRLAFLLYVDSPPRDPTVENAYRELQLWVNVTEPGSGEAI